MRAVLREQHECIATVVRLAGVDIALRLATGSACFRSVGKRQDRTPDFWAAPLESAADRLGGWLCLHLHPGFRLMYDALEWDAVHFPGQHLKQIDAAVNGYDRGFFDDPDVARLFLDATRECFRQGSGGLVEDATLLYRVGHRPGARRGTGQLLAG